MSIHCQNTLSFKSAMAFQNFADFCRSHPAAKDDLLSWALPQPEGAPPEWRQQLWGTPSISTLRLNLEKHTVRFKTEEGPPAPLYECLNQMGLAGFVAFSFETKKGVATRWTEKGGLQMAWAPRSTVFREAYSTCFPQPAWFEPSRAGTPEPFFWRVKLRGLAEDVIYGSGDVSIDVAISRAVKLFASPLHQVVVQPGEFIEVVGPYSLAPGPAPAVRDGIFMVDEEHIEAAKRLR